MILIKALWTVYHVPEEILSISYTLGHLVLTIITRGIIFALEVGEHNFYREESSHT